MLDPNSNPVYRKTAERLGMHTPPIDDDMPRMPDLGAEKTAYEHQRDQQPEQQVPMPDGREVGGSLDYPELPYPQLLKLLNSWLRPIYTLITLKREEVGEEAWLLVQQRVMKELIQQSQSGSDEQVAQLQATAQLFADEAIDLREELNKSRARQNDLEAANEAIHKDLKTLRDAQVRLQNQPAAAPDPRTERPLVPEQPAPTPDTPGETAQEPTEATQAAAQGDLTSTGDILVPQEWLDAEKRSQEPYLDEEGNEAPNVPMTGAQHRRLIDGQRAEALKELRVAGLKIVVEEQPEKPAETKIPAPKKKIKPKRTRSQPEDDGLNKKASLPK